MSPQRVASTPDSAGDECIAAPAAPTFTQAPPRAPSVRAPASEARAVLPEVEQQSVTRQQAGTCHTAPFFLELFAGAGGLTAAIKRLGLPARDALDVAGQGMGAVYADLLDDNTFKNLKKLARRGRIRWLHGGPRAKPSRWPDVEMSMGLLRR